MITPSMEGFEPMQPDDLSHYHHPLRARERAVASSLPAEALARFERDGFVAGIPVLDDSEVEELRAELVPSSTLTTLWARSSTRGTRTSRTIPETFSFTPWELGGSPLAFTTCFGIRPSSCRRASFWEARCASGTISSS